MPANSIGTRRKTVLLVDDDDAVRFVVTRVLEANGYRVLQANSGAEALEVWRSFSKEIDLLFTDLQMPRMSGAELAACLRESRPELRVLYTSGSGITVVEAMLAADPQARFLPKPFRVPAVTTAVSSAINAVD